MYRSPSSIDETPEINGGAASAASRVYYAGRPIKFEKKTLFTSNKERDEFVKEWNELRFEILDLLKKTGKTIYLVPDRDSKEYEIYKEGLKKCR